MKIENIINSCNECRHKRTLREENGNTFYSLICNYQIDSENEFEPFLISFSSSHPKHFANEIPPNCPLEDYK